LLTGAGPGVDRVDRARSVLVSTIGPRQFVDLGLEAGQVSSSGRIRRYCGSTGPGNGRRGHGSDEHSRVVITRVDPELQAQGEVTERLREEQ